MKAHHFVNDGRREDGEPRLRCARCGMLGHWAGARDACPWMDATSVARAAAMSGETRPLVTANGASTHWPGPYRMGRWASCKRCGAKFRHPKKFRVISFCGPMCVHDNALERNRADAAAYRARQAQGAQS